MILRDWQCREYTVEIVFTRFESNVAGYIVHIDDEPFREGELFSSADVALHAVKNHLAGFGA